MYHKIIALGALLGICIAIIFLLLFSSFSGKSTLPCDQEFNYGHVAQGKIIKHEFHVNNPSDRIIKVLDIQATCSCVFDGETPEKILAKQTGVFPVKLDTARRKGKYEPVIKVHLEEYGWIELKFTGEIFSYGPDIIDFKTVKKGIAYKKTFNLESKPNWDLEITQMQFNEDTFSIEKISDEDRNKKTFNLELDTSSLDYGQFEKEILIFRNDPSCPENRIKVVGCIEDIVKCNPNRIFLGKIKSTESTRKRVELYSPYEYNLKVNKTSVSRDGITIENVDSHPRSTHRLGFDVQLDINKISSSGLFKGIIDFDLSVNGINKILSVDVVAVVTK